MTISKVKASTDESCPLHVIEKAKELLNTWSPQGDAVVYDGDEWIGISEDWDLNLFTDEDGIKHGRLYPVRRANTVVNARSFRIG